MAQAGCDPWESPCTMAACCEAIGYPRRLWIWEDYTVTWYSGTGHGANVAFYDENTDALSNDFMFDNIRFRPATSAGRK